MKKNVLLLCPPFSDKGGVAYYYSLINKYFNSERISLSFYYTGKDYTKNQNRVLKSIFDLFLIIKIFPHYDLIILNPSLDFKAFVRDGTFHFIAKRIFHKKTLIFIHGWNHGFEQLIEKYWKKFFKFLFNSDRICVLSTQFKKKLILWGFNPRTINLETTIYERYESEENKDPYKIIFLSRFVERKGCLEAIKTVEILTNEFSNVKLYMVGEGEITYKLKEYVTKHDLSKNIIFTGYLTGVDKYRLLAQCGIMLYPTNYGEGMPISLLEGMGMGLAVVTRPIAGIREIIQEGENGFLIKSIDPNDFAAKIKFLLETNNIWQTISYKNKEMANERFEIRNVVKRLEKLYFQTTQ